MSEFKRDAQGRIVSGALNPGGRMKLGGHLRKKCRDIVDAKVVSAWEQELDERGKHWVRCSELLAAYGYGAPPKTLEDEAGDITAIGQLTIEELRSLARQSLAEDMDADEDDDDEADEIGH